MTDFQEKTKDTITVDQNNELTLKTLVNTPLKRFMFGLQVLSFIIIPASPFIGRAIGKMLDLTTGQTAGVVLGIFIVGEVFFYGSLLFLGKEILVYLRGKVKKWFKIKSRQKAEA